MLVVFEEYCVYFCGYISNYVFILVLDYHTAGDTVLALTWKRNGTLVSTLSCSEWVFYILRRNHRKRSLWTTYSPLKYLIGQVSEISYFIVIVIYLWGVSTNPVDFWKVEFDKIWSQCSFFLRKLGQHSKKSKNSSKKASLP